MMIDSRKIRSILKYAVKAKVSDVHLTLSVPPAFRINGKLVVINADVLTQEDLMQMLHEIATQAQIEELHELGDIDFSYEIVGCGRFRIHVFHQRSTIALAIRVIPNEIPTFTTLKLPNILKDMTAEKSGLIIVSGSTGSGKSTTLAAMIDFINHTRAARIITLEDPIEYLHKNDNAVFSQREVGVDCASFQRGLRAAMRQDPDVILLGEMRDLETIAAALTAAETGHLVLTTLHTSDTSKAIQRIIDSFPAYQKEEVKMQLSLILRGIIVQQLLPCANGTEQIAAFEILRMTSAIANLIREGKTQQILSAIQMGRKLGMQTMDDALCLLVQQKVIDIETALEYTYNKDAIKSMVNGRLV